MNPLLKFFDEDCDAFDNPVSRVASLFRETARSLVAEFGTKSSAETTIALRKLLEARDAAVRAARY